MAKDEEKSKSVAGTAGSAVVELIKAARDTPEGKETATNVGKTLVTVTKAVNNVLLPIAAVNFAFDKARAYFSERFQGDMESVTSTISPDKLQEPRASIAGPALQGLRSAMTNRSCAKCFSN